MSGIVEALTTDPDAELLAENARLRLKVLTAEAWAKDRERAFLYASKTLCGLRAAAGVDSDEELLAFCAEGQVSDIEFASLMNTRHELVAEIQRLRSTVIGSAPDSVHDAVGGA